MSAATLARAGAEVICLAAAAVFRALIPAFAGGGQIGCDYQVGQWVFGIRDMLDGTSLDSGATLPIAPLAGYSYSGNTHWFDTLTARGGYLVQPNILLYAQGGVAWTQTSQSIYQSCRCRSWADLQ